MFKHWLCQLTWCALQGRYLASLALLSSSIGWWDCHLPHRVGVKNWIHTQKCTWNKAWQMVHNVYKLSCLSLLFFSQKSISPLVNGEYQVWDFSSFFQLRDSIPWCHTTLKMSEIITSWQMGTGFKRELEPRRWGFFFNMERCKLTREVWCKEEES